MPTDAGWFADPSGKPQERYWDGNVWTEQVRPFAAPDVTQEQKSQQSAPVGSVQQRNRTGLWVVTAVLGFAGIAALFLLWRNEVNSTATEAYLDGASLGGSSDEFGGIESGGVFPNKVQVTYSVTAIGYQEDRNEPDASVTFETPTGTSQLDVDDGWTKTFTFDAGAFVYLSVQNNTEGFVICKIESDGRTVSKNRSEGRFSIATCDGSS